jgi:flagellar basal-body rod modification protein FlgD
MKATEVINDTANGLPPSSAKPTGSNELDKNAFVKLLLAQLGNQDPTSPVDSQAFVAQLAQFSSLEQLNTVNERLDSLLLATTSTSQTAATAFVGKVATFRTDKLQLGPEGSVVAGGTIDADAETASVAIVDGTGRTVRTIAAGAQKKGDFSLQWDGRDDNGNRLAAGEYTLKVTAIDGTGKDVPVAMRGSGLVTGVSFQNGYPELLVQGGAGKVKMSEIIEINQRSTP